MIFVLFWKTTISTYLFDASQENTTCLCVLGGDSCTLITFILKKGTLELLINNPMSLLQSIYDPPFYKNLICPQSISYNPCPESCMGGGLSSSKTWSPDPSTTMNKIVISKFWLENVKGNDECCRGAASILEALLYVFWSILNKTVFL